MITVSLKQWFQLFNSPAGRKTRKMTLTGFKSRALCFRMDVSFALFGIYSCKKKDVNHNQKRNHKMSRLDYPSRLHTQDLVFRIFLQILQIFLYSRLC